MLGGEANGKIGARVNTGFSDLDKARILFSESTGFVFEVNDKNKEKVEELFLHTIRQEKIINNLIKKIRILEMQID